jgi:hypothetical protein
MLIRFLQALNLYKMIILLPTVRRWSQLNATAMSFSPPPRSYACSVLLNHLIIVYGGRRTSIHLDDSPWMFNTVSNQWSPLLSAKTQQWIPSPRWGQGCLLVPTPGMGSSLATSMHLLGGVSTKTVITCVIFEFFRHFQMYSQSCSSCLPVECVFG